MSKQTKNNSPSYGITAWAVGISVALCLSVVCCGTASLPPDVLADDWQWLYACGVPAVGILALAVELSPVRTKACLPVVVSWALIGYGMIVAVWGLCQMYGLASSRHSLYALTGSFYNPGPYSGYLAMLFPVCLYEWLRRRGGKKTIPYYIALAGVLWMLCVLPAGMSRSAWIAAAISSAYIVGMYYKEAIKRYAGRHRRRVAGFAVAALLLGGMALGGVYLWKKDSADGRLFLWKIAARAVSEHPWTGVGWTGVPAAYGQAQEDYFAAGRYTETEERVAGTPEYVFNEYLQVALAWGIPVLCIGLLVVGGSLVAGHRRRRYGLCGALLSFLVFACASYPLQFPAFVATLFVLVLACGIGTVPLERAGVRLATTTLLLTGGVGCCFQYRQCDRTVAACRQWMESRVLYRSGAYRQAVASYATLYRDLPANARFLFEYGHALHKLHEPGKSNRVLKEALKVSADPMILNIIGKNEQEMKHYAEAEHWLIRAVHRLPGRIYPYYLLARLYAEPACYRRDKLERMVQAVLEKEPKVQSTAVRQMRQEARDLIKKVP